MYNFKLFRQHANETFMFLSRRDCFLSSDKRPDAISHRRLALKLSLTASIHFGERSRALSSIAEASTSSLTHWIFMCCCKASAADVLCARRATERVHLTDAPTLRSSLSRLGTCLKLHSSDRLLRGAPTKSNSEAIEFTIPSITSVGKRLRTVLPGCACRICIHA